MGEFLQNQEDPAVQNGAMHLLRPLLMASCLVSPVHAQQVYKWVDAQGRTHYSQNKDDAVNAKTNELTIKLPPQDAPPPQRQAPAFPQSASKPATNEASRSKGPEPSAKPGWEYSNKPETNESRCALARAVADGSAQRATRKTDQHDRDIAQNDIKAFCR